MTETRRRRRGGNTAKAVTEAKATPGNPAAALEALAADVPPTGATPDAEPDTAAPAITEEAQAPEDAGPVVAAPTPQQLEGRNPAKPSQKPVAPVAPKVQKTAQQIIDEELAAKEAAFNKERQLNAAAVVNNGEGAQDCAEVAARLKIEPGTAMTLAECNAFANASNRSQERYARKLGAQVGKMATDQLLAKQGLRMPGKARKNKARGVKQEG